MRQLNDPFRLDRGLKVAMALTRFHSHVGAHDLHQLFGRGEIVHCAERWNTFENRSRPSGESFPEHDTNREVYHRRSSLTVDDLPRAVLRQGGLVLGARRSLLSIGIHLRSNLYCKPAPKGSERYTCVNDRQVMTRVSYGVRAF